jgi:hypothetical protein
MAYLGAANFTLRLHAKLSKTTRDIFLGAGAYPEGDDNHPVVNFPDG